METHIKQNEKCQIEYGYMKTLNIVSSHVKNIQPKEIPYFFFL